MTATTKQAQLTVAQTILFQLGADKFVAMTGAKNMLALEDGLQFDLPRGMAVKSINKVQITLDANDTYKMRMMNYNSRKFELLDVCERDHVYANDLQLVFTSLTGLHTRL